MKSVYRFLTLLSLLFLFAGNVWADEFTEAKATFEKAGLGHMFDYAYGYALFPLVGKGGFFVGGSYGEGRVYEQGNYVGDTRMIQASIGLQMGGTGFSQVIFFEDQRAFTEFISGDFEFEAEAQATALTASAGASASTSGSSAVASGTKENVAMAGAGFYKGMATYTITRGGLMYEASIGGQRFDFTRR